VDKSDEPAEEEGTGSAGMSLMGVNPELEPAETPTIDDLNVLDSLSIVLPVIDFIKITSSLEITAKFLLSPIESKNSFIDVIRISLCILKMNLLDF